MHDAKVMFAFAIDCEGERAYVTGSVTRNRSDGMSIVHLDDDMPIDARLTLPSRDLILPTADLYPVHDREAIGRAIEHMLSRLSDNALEALAESVADCALDPMDMERFRS